MSLDNIDETFDFVLDKVCSRIEEINIRSAPCMIGNHLWRISTKQVSSNSADSAAVKYLGVYLECGGTAKRKSFWCNFARVQLIIVSQKEGVDDLAKKFKQLYSSKKVDIMGFDNFIAWNDLINPENGFIRCNRIILRAHVCIDNVETVSWGCIGSCGKLTDNMTTAVELNTTENDVKNSATFDFVVENFSKFKNTIRSPACMIHNLSWKILLVKRSEEDDNPSSKINLGFFAECNLASACSSWCCIANIHLTIVSQKEDVDNFAYECRTLFSSSAKDWGYKQFKGWSYVVDPQNGFIKDDIVIFRAYVRVDISPRSVSWASAESREVHNATGIKLKTPNESAKSETSFDLVLEKVSELKDSVISLPCKIHSLPWKIKVIRYKDPADSSSEDTLGIFLVCDEIFQSWSCFVYAQLMIVSLLDADCNENKEIQHTYSSTDNSRGFEKFLSLKDVIDPEFGLFIKHDCIVIRAEIIADVPRGMEWNSKKKTGYVGLKNQGTCFMNSILQTLYFIGQFRKAIYQLPNENNDVKSLTSAFQKIFHQLQTKDEAVNVTNWVRCLRSEALDLFAPIDVLNFVTMLFKKLEDEMKSTCVEGTIRNLFEGKIEYFVKCTNIDHEYRWTKSFYCIELDIRVSVDLSEAFDQYVSDEILDKGLQYDAGDLGLQDARKSIIFESLPPVLLINLDRFDYHHITGYCDKFNEYLDFDKKMDLNKYLKNPQSTPADYTLFAVLAHDGDSHGGRYVVFINPKCDETWYEFDDEVVSTCLEKAAIENNVGREVVEIGTNIRTACVLVYIRDSMIQQVLQEVTKEDIPSELRSTDEDEPEIKRAKREEYISIRVLLEDCFDGHQGPDIFDFTQIPDLVHKEETLIRVFEVEKTKTVEQILTMLSKSFGRPLNQMRIWPFTKRPNQTNRPMYFDIDYNKIKRMDDIVVNNYWDIFLEMFPLDLGNYPLPAFDVEFRVLLFFKLYEPKTRKIYYCEHAYVERDCTIAKLILKLNEKAGYPPDTKLILYEECKSRTLQKIAISPEPLSQIIEEFLDGDIIVFQKDDLAENLPSVETYYAYQ